MCADLQTFAFSTLSQREPRESSLFSFSEMRNLLSLLLLCGEAAAQPHGKSHAHTLDKQFAEFLQAIMTPTRVVKRLFMLMSGFMRPSVTSVLSRSSLHTQQPLLLPSYSYMLIKMGIRSAPNWVSDTQRVSFAQPSSSHLIRT